VIDILGLGVAVVDVIAQVDHFPSGEEVQQAGEITLSCGGPVATALAAVARLGGSTALIDSLGDDWRGDRIRSSLEAAGVDCSRVFVRQGETSGMASVLVRQADGARAIHYSPGSSAEIRPDELDLSWVDQARILHLNGRHFEAAMAAVRHAHSQGVSVSLDGGAGRFRPEFRRLVPLVDICIVARDFARQYTAETDIYRQALRLKTEGPGLVAITDGLAGSYLLGVDGRWIHQPAYPLEGAVDTTGCGDAYHGAFLFGLLRGLSAEDSAALASAVAALNTRGLGGQKALPDLGETLAFLRTRGVDLAVPGLKNIR
jgi:sulfofructose kinase